MAYLLGAAVVATNFWTWLQSAVEGLTVTTVTAAGLALAAAVAHGRYIAVQERIRRERLIDEADAARVELAARATAAASKIVMEARIEALKLWQDAGGNSKDQADASTREIAALKEQNARQADQIASLIALAASNTAGIARNTAAIAEHGLACPPRAAGPDGGPA